MAFRFESESFSRRFLFTLAVLFLRNTGRSETLSKESAIFGIAELVKCPMI
jgi:hypothetical protein